MLRLDRTKSLGLLLAVLAIGLAVGSLLPQSPLHAVSTDSSASCIIATGPMDGGVEAVWVLDTLTGDLKAGVVSKRQPSFRAQYQRNVMADFGLEEGKKPLFLMVTGIVDLARAPGGIRPSTSLVYVAEVNSGVIRGYAVPWAPELHSQDKPANAPLVPWGMWKFRTTEIRD